MKVQVLRLREQRIAPLGIDIALDRYAYVVDVNPVRNELQAKAIVDQFNGGW